MLIKSYARWWRTTDRSPATLQGYVYVLERLAARQGGEAELLKATKADFEEYLGERLQVTKAVPSRTSTYSTAVRSVTMTKNLSSGGGGEHSQLLTYRDLRRRLRISQKTAETLALTGQIRSVRIGAPGSKNPRRMFRPEDVDAYLASLADAS